MLAEGEKRQPVELIEPACTVCGSTDKPEFIANVYDYFRSHFKETFGLGKCKKCGVVYLSPRLKDTARAYEGFYAGSRFGQSIKEVSLGLDRIILDSARVFIINRLCGGKMRKEKNGMRLIDVGCSYGSFLLQCSRICPDVALEGCDMDENAIAESAAANVAKLHVNDVEKPLSKVASNTYDVITLFHSLEHMENPVDAICDARRALAPGGLLYVEVPNYDSISRQVFGSFWLPLFVPQHLTHFSKEGLKTAILMGGFKEHEIVRQNGIMTSQSEIFLNVYTWIWYMFMKMLPEGERKETVKNIRTARPFAYELKVDGIRNPILWAFALFELILLGFTTVVEILWTICIMRTPYAAHHFIAVRKDKS